VGLFGDDPQSMIIVLALLWNASQEIRLWKMCGTCPYYKFSTAKPLPPEEKKI